MFHKLKVVSEIFKPELLNQVSEISNPNSYFNFLPQLKSHHVEHYEQDAAQFDYFEQLPPSWENESKRLHQTILREFDFKNKFILDVGCGSAWVAKELIPSANLVVSMDVSTVNPQKALNKYPSQNHIGVSSITEDLPFLPEIFDYIIASEVMEHVPQPKEFVRSLMSVLKKNGKLIITTPYNEKIAHSLCIHCNKPTPHSAHLHSFNLQNIEKVVENCNYNISKKSTFSNKILLALRTDIITRFFPYFLWKLLDKMANKITNKASRLLIIIEHKK